MLQPVGDGRFQHGLYSCVGVGGGGGGLRGGGTRLARLSCSGSLDHLARHDRSRTVLHEADTATELGGFGGLRVGRKWSDVSNWGISRRGAAAIRGG